MVSEIPSHLSNKVLTIYFAEGIGGINMERVLGYPLTAVPLSVAHIDGSSNKTDIVKVFHIIENMADCGNPD